MQVLEVRSSGERSRDTAVDVPVFRTSRGRGLSALALAVEPDCSASAEVVSDAGERAPRVVGCRRLADLHVAESISRRHVGRVPIAVGAPLDQGAPPPVTVRIAWARTDDSALSVEARGVDAIVIDGEATGEPNARRRSRGVIPLPVAGADRGPSVSVGIDGLIYSIRVARGDDALTVARSLAERLRSQLDVDIEPLLEGAVRVRLAARIED